MEEQIRKDWEITKQVLGAGAQVAFNKKTALDRLRDRYRRIMLLCFIFACYMPPMWYRQATQSGPEYPAWFAWFMLIVFVSCGLGTMWMYRNISRVKVVSMSVDEIIRLCAKCRKTHLCIVGAMLPLTVGGVIALILSVNGNIYLQISMISGICIGLAIGLTMLSRFLRDYRTLIA